ncbi:MAG: glutamate racemase [Rikenellaceae bacterium]|nr:glutamate racemase [Rikenellaceae bacterium]MBQ3536782.1 glutamate racemase [Alistipes sp.]
MDNRPIGVYDSGFGGLSVWRELYRALPEESLIYLGDGKNCPYGSLSEERIRELAEKAVGELIERGCKMVVVACNTATAAAINHLREKFSFLPIVGLEPAVKPACQLSRSGRVAVLATERSLQSEKLRMAVERYATDVEVIKAVGRGFVEAVEQCEEQSEATEKMVSEVVEPLIEQGADVIVLGCTHYPFLKGVLRRVVGSRDVRIIDSGEAVEKRVESLLDRYSLRADEENEAKYEFLTYADEEYRERLRRKAFDK